MGDVVLTNRFWIDVAEDRMSATLRVTVGEHLQPAEVLAAVKELKLRNVNEALVTGEISKDLAHPLSIKIAEGLAPVDERAAKINYRVPVADHENGLVSKVESGKLIATITTPPAGTDGRDVFGQPIAHKKGILPVVLGKNITRRKDQLYADIGGNVRLRDGKLSIERLLEIDGDDDAGTLLVTFEGDVAIKGSLRDGRTLHVGGSLVVGNAVNGAHLRIGGDAIIKGGVVGKAKAKCVIGGQLRCGFITGSSVVAGGNVYSQSEILSSRIFCSGQLQITRGALSGGEVCANGGVRCQTMGDRLGTPMLISVGIDRVTKSLAGVAGVEAAANQKLVDKMREKITPLMAQLKNLTPEQREKVTELLYEADELESKNKNMLADLARRCEQMKQRACAEIHVTEMVYPGVKVRMPGIEATIGTVIQGPLKISLRHNDQTPEIILFLESSGTSFTLPSQLIADPAASQTEPAKLAA